MKQCSLCEQNLANKQFGKDKRTSDGLSPKCFSCRGILPPGESYKRCVMCEEVKHIDEFHRDMQSPDFHRKLCKKCGSRSAKNWNATNRERYNENAKLWREAHKDATKASQRRYHLKKTYKLTEEEYWMIFDSQKGKCYICGRSARTKHLHVDHDHSCCKGTESCGKCVRGLICSPCNKDLLPYVDHRPEAIEKALEYVKNPPAQKLLREHRTKKPDCG